jgi:hypothetical protein
LSVYFVAARGLARLFHRIRGILTLFALIRILREHLAIDRGNAEHVSNGVTGDRIGHTNDIEVNVWSIELGELARVDFRIPSREIFSDHDVSSLATQETSRRAYLFPCLTNLSRLCPTPLLSLSRITPLRCPDLRDERNSRPNRRSRADCANELAHRFLPENLSDQAAMKRGEVIDYGHRGKTNKFFVSRE